MGRSSLLFLGRSMSAERVRSVESAAVSRSPDGTVYHIPSEAQSRVAFREISAAANARR